MLTYGSVCSGIEAASVAWEPLGMRPAWFAEIEPFPAAVLAHRWPHVPNLGDMVAFSEELTASENIAPTLQRGGEGGHHDGVMLRGSVRRLMPVECERLQGFSDGHTLIPWRGKAAADCPDGLRYKALGNSMAVPVMSWIGMRMLAHVGGGV